MRETFDSMVAVAFEMSKRDWARKTGLPPSLFEGGRTRFLRLMEDRHWGDWQRLCVAEPEDWLRDLWERWQCLAAAEREERMAS